MWKLSLCRSACVSLFITSLCMASTASVEVVLYVDNDAPPGGDGMSWDTAYQFLQDAFAYASDQEVKEIHVGEGFYKPDLSERNPKGTGQRDATFLLINSVAIMGGYAGIGTDDPNARDIELYETTLSGDLANNDGPPGSFENNEENSYHVVTGSQTDETAIIDGFVITGGNAIDSEFYKFGGGLFNLTGSPTVSNCSFSHHTARLGAGMYNSVSSSPTVTNCIFYGNVGAVGTTAGAGMYNFGDSNPLIVNCLFTENVAIQGGGLYAKNSSPVIINCTFSLNNASGGAAAVFSGGGEPFIFSCTFEGNLAENKGGALLVGGNTNITITNCDFISNSTESRGGAVYINCLSSEIIGCTFSNNTASFNGGALMLNYIGTHTLHDSVFTNNNAAVGGAMYHTATDTLVSQVTFSSNSASVGGGLYVGEGNLELEDATFQENEAVFGGAVYVDHANPTLENCLLDDNFAILDGGGLYNDMGSPSLINCIVLYNSSLADGGGIYNIHGEVSLVDCTVKANYAQAFGAGMFNFAGELFAVGTTFSHNLALGFGFGGGLYNELSNSTLIDCAIFQNTASQLGGAMYNIDSNLIIEKCRFTDNKSEWDHGGAMANYSSSLAIVNSTFSDNDSGGKGGAMYNEQSTSQILNCIFWFNQAIEFGGGLSNISSDTTIINTTFYANSALVGYGGAIANDQSTINIANSILWGDFPSEVLDTRGSQSVIRHSNVQGGWGGDGNIDLNPLFEAEVPYADQLRLTPGSPCIDAGDNFSLPKGSELDLDGNPRFLDDPCAIDTGSGSVPIVDMGAYEFQGSSCDLNSDGLVNTSDLLLLFANWGPCADCVNCPIDLDNNCSVGLTDLEILLDNWG